MKPPIMITKEDREIVGKALTLEEISAVFFTITIIILTIIILGSAVAKAQSKPTSTAQLIPQPNPKTTDEKLADTNLLLSKYAKELAACKRLSR